MVKVPAKNTVNRGSQLSKDNEDDKDDEDDKNDEEDEEEERRTRQEEAEEEKEEEEKEEETDIKSNNPHLAGGEKMCAYTSRTAQGGGGSFKHGKPIGEVGCCESRMAERNSDGPKGGWSCVFWSGCNSCSGHLTTTAGCSVV